MNGKKPEPVWPIALGWLLLLFTAIYLVAQVLRVVL